MATDNGWLMSLLNSAANPDLAVARARRVPSLGRYKRVAVLAKMPAGVRKRVADVQYEDPDEPGTYLVKLNDGTDAWYDSASSTLM